MSTSSSAFIFIWIKPADPERCISRSMRSSMARLRRAGAGRIFVIRATGP